MEFSFPKISDSFHQRFVIHISSDSANDEISLALGEPFEYRFNLSVNGQTMDRDLLFQHRCALGLDSLFKPGGNQ
jgi:hypothetical protein